MKITHGSIVVGTDFSSGSHLAVERAAWLAAAHDRRLCLTHVLNESAWDKLGARIGVAQAPSAEQFKAKAVDRLERLARDIRRRIGADAQARLVSGVPHEELNRLVHAERAELVVVGASGERRLRNLLLGGTALKLLRVTARPVLIARTKPGETYERVLLTTDFSERAKRAARVIATLAPKARLDVVHAYRVPFEGRMRVAGASEIEIRRYRRQLEKEAKQQLQAFATACNLSPGRRVKLHAIYGAPAWAVIEASEELESDLVVVGKHSGGATGEIVLGSVTQNLIHHVRCDVLLVS